MSRWLALLFLSVFTAGCVGQCAPDIAVSVHALPLENTYWRAVTLAGQSVPAQEEARREAHLQFTAEGRVTGSDGCNRVMGTYALKGETITFGPIAGTKMACSDSAATERAFGDALARSARWTIVGSRLELSAASGPPLAVFEAQPNK